MPQRLIIAGGGLSGVLAALAFAARRPDVSLTVVEAGPRLGGNHTWSFYATDLDGEAEALVDPLIGRRWAGYDVAFEGFSRTLSTGYRTVTSDALHAVAAARLGDRLRLGAAVAGVDGAGVTLATGERLAGDAVIDARGPGGAGALAGAVLRWQTFLGREVRLAAPHGLTRPTIMDARVTQFGGYRFVYLLPFGPDTVLIEDTSYTDAPAIDPVLLRGRIDAYAAARGWRIAESLREETGALPLLLSGDVPVLWQAAAPAGGAVPLGLRAGLFHPLTGYSLPLAARTAVALAALDGPITTQRLRRAVEEIVKRHFARTRFDRLLNRMLFLAGAPQDRHRVLARFHRLPQPTIERFYAGRLRSRDRLRILLGKPPVPLSAALRAVPERAARETTADGGARR